MSLLALICSADSFFMGLIMTFMCEEIHERAFQLSNIWNITETLSFTPKKKKTEILGVYKCII